MSDKKTAWPCVPVIASLALVAFLLTGCGSDKPKPETGATTSASAETPLAEILRPPEPAGDVAADNDSNVVELPLAAAEPAEEAGQTAALPSPGGPSQGDRTLIEQNRFSPRQIGYVVYDASDGRLLAARNSDAYFIPASVAKLPTAIMALETLGPDHRFATRMLATGEVKNGVLEGDLYLVGGGDPFLEPLDLDGFVDRLSELGIKRVAGKYYYDQSFLIDSRSIEPTQPEDAGYNPGISALSLTFNRIRLKWQRKGQNGVAVTEASAHSDIKSVPLESFSLGLTSDRADIWQDFYYDGAGKEKPRWLLADHMRKKGNTWLPVKKPGAFTADVLRTVAARQNITLPAPAMGQAPAEARLIYRRESVPLLEIVTQMLEYSNNLTAEIVGLSASRKLAGAPVPLADSANTLGHLFGSKLPETDWRGFSLANHSGLSSKSRVTPGQIGAILRAGLGKSYGGMAFQSVLPYRTKPGGADSSEPVMLWAKSGTMDYARGLAGLAQVEGGKPVIFVIFITDFEKRRAYDADPMRQSPRSHARARKWLRRARTLEKELLRSWVSLYGVPEMTTEMRLAGRGY